MSLRSLAFFFRSASNWLFFLLASANKVSAVSSFLFVSVSSCLVSCNYWSTTSNFWEWVTLNALFSSLYVCCWRRDKRTSYVNSLILAIRQLISSSLDWIWEYKNLQKLCSSSPVIPWDGAQWYVLRISSERRESLYPQKGYQHPWHPSWTTHRIACMEHLG